MEQRKGMNRRMVVMAMGAALLAGCSVIPKGPATTPSDPTRPDPTDNLPQDSARHRIALLVPMTGDNGAVGQSIANATTMALLDTSATNLRITTYDTSKGARAAARNAVRDGNKLILGPLLGEDVLQVQAEARPANIPLISFSNDTAVAGPDVFVMGQTPDQSIARTVKFAQSRGKRQFAILVPEGDYGARAEAALRTVIAQSGGRFVGSERYSRGNTSIVSAAQRLKARGGYDAVLIADGARLAAQAADTLKPKGAGNAQLLGTELWSGESALTRSASLRGAIFSAVSDARYKRFVESYETRFGSQPYRVATLGYDSVLLTLNVARDWKVGRNFPVDKLRSDVGFLGLDGAFRFQRSGQIERAMEVFEVRNGSITVIDKAPASF